MSFPIGGFISSRCRKKVTWRHRSRDHL